MDSQKNCVSCGSTDDVAYVEEEGEFFCDDCRRGMEEDES